MGIIKIILLSLKTDSQVLYFCYCLKKKCCKCFECLLPCETIKTVTYYHQKPCVRNFTGLHRIKSSLITSLKVWSESPKFILLVMCFRNKLEGGNNGQSCLKTCETLPRGATEHRKFSDSCLWNHSELQ